MQFFLWWARARILDDVEEEDATWMHGVRFWLCMGTREGSRRGHVTRAAAHHLDAVGDDVGPQALPPPRKPADLLATFPFLKPSVFRGHAALPSRAAQHTRQESRRLAAGSRRPPVAFALEPL